DKSIQGIIQRSRGYKILSLQASQCICLKRLLLLIPQDFILSPFFISGYSLNRIPAQARCNSVHNPHVLNGFISELLYMETVRNTTGGRKADTGYLFHIEPYQVLFPLSESACVWKVSEGWI
ncbi:hypothetical protein, partial [Bacteroides sp. AGMB03916]